MIAATAAATAPVADEDTVRCDVRATYQCLAVGGVMPAKNAFGSTDIKGEVIFVCNGCAGLIRERRKKRTMTLMMGRRDH